MLSSTGESTSQMLPELYIDNFDDEQIFQQLEVFNNHSIKEHRKAIKSVQARYGTSTKGKDSSHSSLLNTSKHITDDSQSVKKQVTFKSDNISDLVADADNSAEEEIEADSNVDSEEESVLQKLLDSISNKKTPVDNDDVVDDDDDDEDSEAMLNSESSDDSDVNDNRTASASQHRIERKQKNRQVSAVDDRFFKLAEMEAFLDEQDLKEQRQHSAEAHDTEYDDGDDDDYDLSADDKVVLFFFNINRYQQLLPLVYYFVSGCLNYYANMFDRSRILQPYRMSELGKWLLSITGCMLIIQQFSTLSS